MTIKIPFLVSGFAGVAVVAALSLPAAAATPVTTTTTAPPVTTTAPPTSAAPPTTTTAPPHLPRLDLLNGSVVETLRAHPGEAIDIGAGCHIVDSGQPHLREGFLASSIHYALSDCPTGSGSMPDWIGTVGKTVHNGTYTVSFTWHGKTYSGKVQVVGGTPPVTTPTRPTQPTQSVQQIPQKPKGAPQTGGGGMADEVSSWG